MSKKSKVIEFPNSPENTYTNNKKRKNHKKRRINLFNLLFIVFILYFCMTYISQMQMTDDLNKQIATLEKERDKQKAESDKLANDVSQIDNKQVFLKVVERIARNEFNMVLPNEVVYIDKNKASNKFITGIGDAESEDDKEKSTDETSEDNTLNSSENDKDSDN